MSAHNMNNDSIDDEVVSDDNNVNSDNTDDEIVSDDESIQRQRTRRSAFKRRRIGSDDEEDEKPATDDEDDEVNQNDADDDSKTHMNNKKLKRIKSIPTSSQESVQSTDTEVGSGSQESVQSADTEVGFGSSQESVQSTDTEVGSGSQESVHSADTEVGFGSSQESVQSTDTEVGSRSSSQESVQSVDTEVGSRSSSQESVQSADTVVGDEDNINQLREFQKDDGRTVELMKHYILWFALKAGGEDVEDKLYQETKEMKRKLDARIDVTLNICQSQAWGQDFRADVKTYPEYNDNVKHSDLVGGDMRHLKRCQVCNREDHPWSVIVKLEGEPYNRESYQMTENEEGESSLDLPPAEYYMGCFCHPRTKLYHNLYHFGHALYHKCKEMLENYDDDDEKKIDKVAKDKSLLIEMYTKLKKLMKEAENDYTVDGKRGNDKWRREYN